MADIEINTGAEAIPEVIVEPAIETGGPTENAVAIVAIEQEGATERERIYAEARVEEARIEAENRDKDSELWQNMNRLSEQVAEMTGVLEGITLTLSTLSQPPSSPEPAPPPTIAEPLPAPIETAPEALSIPSSTSPETDLTPTEPIAESVLAEVGTHIPPVLSVKKGPTIRLI